MNKGSTIEKLESWRSRNCSSSKKLRWSICGPDKRFDGEKFRITLYIYSTRHGRYLNEASKSGDTLEEAFDNALKLWKKRQAIKK